MKHVTHATSLRRSQLFVMIGAAAGLIVLVGLILGMRAHQTKQTQARESLVRSSAQDQLSQVGRFYNARTWGDFLYGTRSMEFKNGVLTAGSRENCFGEPDCFIMNTQNVTGLVPEAGSLGGPLPGSRVQLSAASDNQTKPLSVIVTVHYSVDVTRGASRVQSLSTTFTAPEAARTLGGVSPQGECRTPSDIVLMLDTSESMTSYTWNGPQTRFDVMLDVAETFVTTSGIGVQNRLAIIDFNSAAHDNVPGFSLSPKTGIRIISRLRTASGSNYNVALDAAKEVLARARPDANKVLVMISDGLPDQYGDTTVAALDRARLEAIERARAMKAAGITIYTIGVNADSPNSPALTAMAGNPPGVYASAQTPAALLARVTQLATELSCN